MTSQAATTVDVRHEKMHQAAGILHELDIDCWLTFARETTETGDPVLSLILGHAITWQSAFLVTRDGARIAIVGKYEDEAMRSTGLFTEVMSYTQSIREVLVDTLTRLGPRQLAINYSLTDVKADGLSHGMFELLKQHLAGTPFVDRLCSAESVIGALRGRKTHAEVERLRGAIATTDEIFRAVAAFAEPGISELAISQFMHGEVARRSLGTSWEHDMCPIVNTGPESMVGHGLPSDTLTVRRGNLFHLDFGVRQDDYCSDIQRVWYVPADGETGPPAAVQAGFDTVVRAIRAASEVLRPGVECWTVDEAARRVIVDAGYAEYQHATGHHVGRAAHDGAGVLGPRWERYGQAPFYRVEEGNVFTLELGIENLDGRGYLGLEEMVLVTTDGVEWLSTPQTTLPLLPVA